MNDGLLSAIELLMLRSGCAYRLAHLHHHAHYPHDDDPEGRASHGSLLAALTAGPTYVPRLYPAVPHHNWRRLAIRLDPIFERFGIRAVRVW